MLLSHPGFQLFSATLYETMSQGVMRNAYAQWKKDERFQKIRLGDNDIPVGLRWTTHPELGFPRQAFKVFRRPSVYTADQVRYLVQNGQEAVNVTRSFSLGADMYLMAVSCTLTAGQSLLLTPLGRDQVPMKAKAYRMDSSGTIMFKAPFMNGLRCEGIGQVTNLAAIPMSSILQAGDWTQIQSVGFPFAAGTVQGQGYSGDPQGFTGSETDPETAALMRLQLGEWLFLPPASVNAADSQLPDIPWRHPDPEQYLKLLYAGQLDMIGNCLRRSDDLSYERSKRQVSFTHKVTIPGISQPGSSSNTNAHAVLPVVQHTILSVSNESPAALGLGFGTYDFVPLRSMPSGMQTHAYAMATNYIAAAPQMTGFDYMVTADYTIRPFDAFELPFLDNLSSQVSFCALNDERSIPVTPAGLAAIGIQINRPDEVDAPYTQSVKLRWSGTALPQGFAALASYGSGQLKVLNDAYDFRGDSYQNLFLPVIRPEQALQDPADAGKSVLMNPEEPLPFSGSVNHKYLVAGWDVFGRWTPWSKCGHTATAPPAQQPGILSLRLVLEDPDGMYDLSPTAPEVACKLEIEFSWDWIDRRPDTLQLAGQFVDAVSSLPPAAAPAGFALSATDTTTGLIEIRFPSNDPDTVPICNRGSISIIRPNTAGAAQAPLAGSSDIPSANLKKYKLVVPGIRAHFTGVAPYEVAYRAAIRGLEKVRVSTNDWSPWAQGPVNRLADPRPPAVTVLPATVLFTAVPDATKTAGGQLSWPPATGALSYIIWEANETAIRSALKPLLEAAFPSQPEKWLKALDTPLLARATQLRDLLQQEQYQAACQRYFSRLSRDPVRTTKYELRLPGSADGLYLYQVSSVNSANIESVRSNPCFVAVPKVASPSAPIIQVRPYRKNAATDPDGNGLEITVAHSIGSAAAGYDLYRSRKKILSNDPGMKGPPVLRHDDPRWRDTTIALPDGTRYPGKKILALDISRSWRPFAFQAVAIGKADPERGIIAGASEGSPTELAYFPPDTAPTLVLTGTQANSFSTVCRLQTNAPFEQIPLGKTLIDIYSLDNKRNRSLMCQFVAAATERNDLPLAPAANAAAAALLPQLRHQAADKATGITSFALSLPRTHTELIVRITDPLNRSTELYLSL